MNDFPVLFWPLAVVGVILTGISKSGFAGGAGVVAVPLMALVIPIEYAICIMLPLLLMMDVQTIRYYWQNLDVHLLIQLLPPAVVGITVGGFMLGTVQQSALQLTLCALCIMFSLWQPLLQKMGTLRQSGPFWGGISGLTSTLIHAGGPPVNAYLMTLDLKKLTWLATAGTFFGVMNVIKVIPYTLSGAWQPALLIHSLLLAPVAWCGIRLGRYIQQRLNEQHFVRFCRVLLLMSGLLLGVKAIVQ